LGVSAQCYLNISCARFVVTFKGLERLNLRTGEAPELRLLLLLQQVEGVPETTTMLAVPLLAMTTVMQTA
jgi:hypothetical protein